MPAPFLVFVARLGLGALVLSASVAHATEWFVPQHPGATEPGTQIVSLYTTMVDDQPVPLMTTRTPDGKECDGYVRSVDRQPDGFVAIALGEVCRRDP